MRDTSLVFSVGKSNPKVSFELWGPFLSYNRIVISQTLCIRLFRLFML